MGAWLDGPGVVVLPDGRRVRGCGVRDARSQLPEPEFAVYLLGRDPGAQTWPQVWVRWRDFGTPRRDEDALAALTEAHDRAASQRVEIACGGGTGRTGCAMAVLAAMCGVSPDEVLSWVRGRYRKHAVETPSQRRWVRAMAAAVQRH